jgi:hypothetical protein
MTKNYTEEELKAQQIRKEKYFAAKEKKLQKKAKEEEKQYYDVKQEVLAPVTIFYKVLASSPKEAAEMVEKRKVLPKNISKPNIAKSISSEIYVYIIGTVNKVFYKKR